MQQHNSATRGSSLFENLQRAITPKIGALTLSLAGLAFEASPSRGAELPADLPTASATDEPHHHSPVDVFIQDCQLEGHFSGTFNSKSVTGTLCEQGVDCISIDSLSCQLISPVPLKEISPVLKNIVAATRCWNISYPDEQIQSIDTVDGDSFVISSGSQTALFHHGELFSGLTSRTSNAEQPALEQESITSPEEIRSQVSDRFNELLPEQYKTEMEKRILLRSLTDRIETVKDKIDAQQQVTENLPFNSESWEVYRESFEKKVEKPFQQAISSRSLTKLRDLDKALKGFEKGLSLSSPETTEFSLHDLSKITERLDRSASINLRRNNVETTLKSNPGTRGKFAEFDQKWRQLVNSWNKPHGWDRWDPASLNQEDHREVLVKLDALLKEYEGDSLPEGASLDSTLATHYRMQQLQIESSQQGGSDPLEVITEYSDENGSIILTQTTKGESITRKYKGEELAVTETIKDGRLSSRTTKNTAENIKSSEYFNEDGVPTYRYEYTKSDQSSWELKSLTRFHPNGTVRYCSTTDDATFFCRDGKKITHLDINPDTKQISGFSVFSQDGTELKDYLRQNVESRLSTSAYIKKLAEVLDTGEKLHIFFDTCFKYTSDTTEKWQSASESLQRVREGRMRGDCDDYAFLARAILEHQGQHPHVLHIPGHALCVWLTRDSDGKYHARSIGTFGYDHNGKRYQDEDFVDTQPGADTLKQAVNLILKKYRFPGLGLAEGQDYQLSSNSAQILRRDDWGNRAMSWWSLDTMLRHRSN